MREAFMHIKKHYHEVEGLPVSDETMQGVTKYIAVGPEHGANNFTLRVFELAPGGFSPKHHHDFEHEIFVHAGRGEVFYEGKTMPIGPGSVAFVEPDALHQIVNTGDDKLIFVCVIPNRE